MFYRMSKSSQSEQKHNLQLNLYLRTQLVNNGCTYCKEYL